MTTRKMQGDSSSAASALRSSLSLAVVCLGTLVASLDSAVNIALPSITSAFRIELEDVRWVVIAYVLTYSCLLLVFGRLGDLLGYRHIFQFGLIASAAGFAFCSLAPSFEFLLLGRVLQGCGIALTLSCAPALATTIYDERQRTRVIGIYAAVTALGAAHGPLVGGILVDVFGWTVVFWMRVPIALAAFALTWIIPVRNRPGSIEGFDALGAGLLIIWLVALLLGLALRNETGGMWARIGFIGIALVALLAFLRCESRHPQPIIRLALFRDAAFTLMNLISIIVNYAAFSILLLVPFFLVGTAGLDSGRSGAVLALAAIGSVAGSWIAGRAAARIEIKWFAPAGVLLTLTGLGTIAQWSQTTGISMIAISLLVHGLGVGFFVVAYTDGVTAMLPLKERGVAGSLTLVTRTIGVVLGATMHAAIQQIYENTAKLSGATSDEAFIVGFQTTFLAAAIVLISGLALSLLQMVVGGRASVRR